MLNFGPDWFDIDLALDQKCSIMFWGVNLISRSVSS